MKELYRTAGDHVAIALMEISKGSAAEMIKAASSDEIAQAIQNMRDDKVTLEPGIGRKTANTILINAYGIVEGIPVDTWVIKLSPRLGLSIEKNPDKIEKDLMEKIDRKYWHDIAYVLKRHGKALCKAIPECSKCPVKGMCPRNGVKKAI